MPADDAIVALRSNELPLLDHVAYFDYATVGPIPQRHVRAAAEVLERLAEHGPTAGEGTRLLEDVRAEAARLLHSDPSRVALLKSTSEGLTLLAEGLDWRPGDEVVLYEREFVGCAAPFLRLGDRGVRVRWIPDRGDRFDLTDVEAALTPRTRAVCVSAVDRSHGARAPLDELGALCRERGLWFAVDAAQAMGVIDFEPGAIGVDVLAAHGYKYLCSGFGLAVVHCSPRAIEELRVPQVGWKNASVDGDALTVASDDARRFESTMSSLAGLAGMQASLSLLNELDPKQCEQRAVARAAGLAERLFERGYTVPRHDRPETRSTIVAAQRGDLDPDRLAQALSEHGVTCAAIDGALRLSTHAFTIGADLDRLFDALPDAERSARR